ncbi:MAG: hypothetical protein ACI8X5_002695 [Planctomycetota bacterium]|jgi:hypothetical protein
MIKLLTALAIVTGLSSCISTHSVRIKPKKIVLLETVNDGGEELVFTLMSGSNGVPSISRTSKLDITVASIGLRTRAINGELAEASALMPWRGVLVDRVESASPAARAGIVKGDVLLSFAGTELSTGEQLEEIIESGVEPGAEVVASVLQVGTNGKYAVDPTELTISMGTKQVSVTKSDTTKLQGDKGVFRLTGMQVGTLPPELAKEVYGSAHPVTLIAASLAGSPAYLAGVRAGDRVVSCDGTPVSSYQDVSREILARSLDIDMPVDWFDASMRKDLAEKSGSFDLEVDGPLGQHLTNIEVQTDLYGNFDMNIPILYEHHSGVDRTSWSFLDFIFQFGANYRSRYRSSETRATQEDTSLSIFPFGMFEFESEKDYDSYRFFWFIRFKDRH